MNSQEKELQIQSIKTDLNSALALFKLVNKNIDKKNWRFMLKCFRKLQSFSVFDDIDNKIINNFPNNLPERILRRDRGLWEATIYFIHDNKSFFVSFDGELNIQLRMKNTDIEIVSSTFQNHGGVADILNQIDKMASENDPKMIGTETYFALWVSRGYDTLQRISQFRMLNRMFIDAPLPKLAIHERGNLIDPLDVFPFIKNIERISEPDQWRLSLSLQNNLVECLKFDSKNMNSFHSGIIEICRHLADFEDNVDAHKDREDIRIFISIEAEKRQAINQIDLFSALIDRFKKMNNDICVYVNGMTGAVDGSDDFEDIGIFEKNIIESLTINHENVRFIHMHNFTFTEKLRLCKHLDFYIAPLGTAMLVPLALNIPGIVYNSPNMLRQFIWLLDEMPSITEAIPYEWTRTVEDDHALRKYTWGISDNSRTSYILDVDKIVDKCISYYENIKVTGM